MTGFAQKLFLEMSGKIQVKKSVWPALEKCVADGIIGVVDYAIAQEVLSYAPSQEETAFFIAYMSLASREGHICIRLDDDCVYPEVKGLPAELLRTGAACLPDTLFEGAGPLRRERNLYYLQRHWLEETSLICKVKEFLLEKPILEADPTAVKKKVDERTLACLLKPEQAEAIISASCQSLSVIFGGPGTGKTYTAGHLVNIIMESLQTEQRNSFEIALAAPTGKAAANLEKSLKKVAGGINVQGKTLHALLGVKSKFHTNLDEIPKLTADLVVIDECSMVDLGMMLRLFSALKLGSRLILLGDPFQLPSVETGSIFADLVHFLKFFPSCKPCELLSCQRVELQSILDFAACVKEGDVNKALKSKQGTECRILEKHAVHPHEIQEQLLGYTKSWFLPDATPQRAFESLNRHRLLSPIKKGPLGVDEINRKFRQALVRKVKHGQQFSAPIMIAKNDYSLELFNGETGILVKTITEKEDNGFHFQIGDYALFPDMGTGTLRKIPALLLPTFEYAYCMSVHKSQGSEFDHVLLLLPEGSELFGREVLYTAVTRARKKLEIWSHENILEQTIERQSRRLSGFVERLQCI